MRYRSHLFLWIVSLINLLRFVLPGNITIISITTHAEGRVGSWSIDPVYDVVVAELRASHPVLLENVTHIPLHSQPNGTGEGAVPVEMDPLQKDPPPRFCEVNNISDYFFKYYYDHSELFTGRLDEQFTMVSFHGKAINWK